MIPVIDVFAGPGGLNEGFSSIRDTNGNPVFKTVASFEMERSAVSTLRFRSAVRHARLESERGRDAVAAYLNARIGMASLMEDSDFVPAYNAAKNEVHQFELSPASRDESDAKIRKALQPYEGEPWVLIGGPPCQAYSLAGRSRRVHDTAFEDDHKHFLYREYLNIIRQHRPTIFVMENVKGLLSSVNRGERMFDMIQEDLRKPGPGLEYDLYSMVSSQTELEAKDFVIRAEQFGVPQRRHRLIIVGVLRGSGLVGPPPLKRADVQITVGDALRGMPEIRSTISRTVDPEGALWTETWREMKRFAQDTGLDLVPKPNLNAESSNPSLAPREFTSTALANYFAFIRPPGRELLPTLNHQARGHRKDDLIRYGLLSALAQKTGKGPKVRDLDRRFWPNHKNITNDVVPFQDRFRVQLATAAATTVVSHIAKDGHYYIHPDPAQMRSFTVREAARMQSFPDDYVFLGNRTQQFTQVGNAVPPLLARQIGHRIWDLLSSSHAN